MDGHGEEGKHMGYNSRVATVGTGSRYVDRVVGVLHTYAAVVVYGKRADNYWMHIHKPCGRGGAHFQL